MIRHEYSVMPSTFVASGRSLPPDVTQRQPGAIDLHELAALMDDAYRGTIDSEGETLEQAIGEVAGYLDSEARLDLSVVAERDGALVSAVLMSQIEDRPLVGYAMTRAAAKNQGFASALLDAAVAATWAAGHEELRAFITQGNLPSEAVFLRAGFAVIGTTGAADSA